MCLLGACTRLLVVVPFLLQSQPLTDPVACHTPSPAFCLTSNLLGRVKPSSERLPSFQCRNPVSPSSRFPPCQGKALELCSYHFVRNPLAIRRGDPLTLSSLQMASLPLSKPQASSYSLWPPLLRPLVLSSDKNDGWGGSGEILLPPRFYRYETEARRG